MSKKYYEFRADDEVAQPSDVTSDTTHLMSEGVANQYSSTSVYAVGDYCIYNGKAYICNTAIESPGEAWTVAHWTLANLSSLFSVANTSLSREVRYDLSAAITATATLADRTVNLVQVSSADIDLTLPGVRSDGRLRDLLVRIEMADGATGTPSLVAFAVWEGDDMPTFAAGKNYLLTLTETKANTWYIKAIELEAKTAPSAT